MSTQRKFGSYVSSWLRLQYSILRFAPLNSQIFGVYSEELLSSQSYRM